MARPTCSACDHDALFLVSVDGRNWGYLCPAHAIDSGHNKFCMQVDHPDFWPTLAVLLSGLAISAGQLKFGVNL